MKFILPTTVAALIAASGAASAATTYATSVIDYSPSGQIAADRTDPTAALGEADDRFTSLGLGGEITLGFDGPVTGDIQVFEVTNGSGALLRSYPEAVDIFALSGGAETFVGRLGNAEAQDGAALSYGGVFDALRLVDVTPDGPSGDGFDVDGISVTSPTPVPLPASGLLLVAGLAGIGAMRRRAAT